jgi:hypothetical protein
VTEERSTTDSTAGGASGSTGEPVETQPQTVEEAEAFWRNRFSNRDRAHNAETQALRAQIDALKTAPAPPPENESPEARRVRELEGELQRERNARAVVSLQQKYPLAAATVGDAILTMDEAKIAGLEAALDGAAPVTNGGPRPVIDPNAAPRRQSVQAGSPAAKPLHEKTKDELLADLKRAAPYIQEAAREGSSY